MDAKTASRYFGLVAASILLSTLLWPLAPVSADAPPPSYNLQSYWSMDESGSYRTDNHGGNHLANYNATSVGGLHGNATRFSSSGAYLYGASVPAGSDGGWSAAFWWRATSTANAGAILEQHASDGGLSTRIHYDPVSGHLKFTARGLCYGTTPITTTVESAAAISTSTWYHVAVWHTASGDIRIQVNDGAVDSEAHLCGLASTASGPLYIGQSYEYDVDELSIYNHALASYEQSWLYNSGAGRTYSDFNYPVTPTPGYTPTPVSTPTPYDYPQNYLADPAMDIEPGNPRGGEPWSGGDWIGHSACYGPTDWSSDWGTNFWGILDKCHINLPSGFWWTAETALEGQDGFGQSFNWDVYSDMLLTWWVHTAPGECSHMLVTIRYTPSGAEWHQRAEVCAGSNWERLTARVPAGASCPGDIGCPGPYTINFVTENLQAWDSDCNQAWYNWDRMLFVDGVSISPDRYYGCPGEQQPPAATSTPSPTPSVTPTWDPANPTPTYYPTATPQPTSQPPASRTPTYTPISFATWTPGATWTAWPTVTPLPLSTGYSTPPGAWGTPVFPTLAPIATVEAVGGFTPDATYEARVDQIATSIAFGSIMSTRAYTYTNHVLAWTDPDADTGGLGSMVTAAYSITHNIALPIGYVKSIQDYLPNLWPLIMTLLLALLWILMVLIIKFSLAVIGDVIDVVIKIIGLIGEYLPTGG